ncbi:MAG: ribosomal protein S18-alanine N-acetyltransferase, partial [Actinomycetota bacterium]|nr:ribosomal protein S18-alanine N-acetyltransferase [Actinomycetota bacterium]
MTTVMDEVLAVQPMRRRDIRAVRTIDRQVYPTPWSAALYLDELGNRHTRVYRIGRFGPRIVGYAGAMLVHDEGHITSVAVDPSAQGRGVAARLLAAVHRGMLRLGAESMTLEVRASNRRAQDLYRQFGYAPAGMRKAYYSDRKGGREDALVMWCHDVH